MKSTKERNNEKFGEYEVPEIMDKLPLVKPLSEEMLLLPVTSTDYINQGYRCYKMSDFDNVELAKRIPNICRREWLEIMVIGDTLYVRDTYKYDQPKNPYAK